MTNDGWHYGAVYDPEHEVWLVSEIYHVNGKIGHAETEIDGGYESVEEMVEDLEAMLADVKRHHYRWDGETLKEDGHAGE